MHCEQCGKENRPNSKFCRFCGSPLSSDELVSPKARIQKSFVLRLTNPYVIGTLGIIILIGLGYAGMRVYGYFKVQSKIHTAEKLQTQNDLKGSIEMLNTLMASHTTLHQKAVMDTLKADDEKFIEFKASFDAAVVLENQSPTSSLALQTALTDLQSISQTYPDFKAVQQEITEVKDSLVVTLQGDADTSKKAATDASSLAEKNHQAAVSAQAAKARAEQNAVDAENNAQAQANQARAAEVAKSFINQLITIKTDYDTNALGNANKGITYWRDGDFTSASLYLGAALNACQSAQTNAKGLNSTFTGMPSSYVDAANNMASTAYYLCASMTDYLNDYISSAVTDINYSSDYEDRVSAFLSVIN